MLGPVNIGNQQLKSYGVAIRITILSLNQTKIQRIGWALLDTGAQITYLQRKIIQDFSITPANKPDIIDTGFTEDGSKKEITRLIYEELIFSVTELTSNPITLSPISEDDNIEKHEFRGEPIIAILGRDFLSLCTLVYNGVEGTFSLSLPNENQTA